MKRFISSLVIMSVMALAVPMMPVTASAATSGSAVKVKCYRTTSGALRCYKKPNIYQRHRAAFNVGIGAAAGALLGGLIGGRRGAVIGGLAGAGGGGVYTKYVQKPKNYVRYYRP
jgi:outer membrane lipoprotein SlyB